ncbi:MAG TPA: sigma-70 family RNA polymerase sigma factor [Acidobacteriaceae bacterium]|nr:sigma-70 family RNA polymerase sigma factor [Acidobacteriaceae bacterium]
MLTPFRSATALPFSEEIERLDTPPIAIHPDVSLLAQIQLGDESAMASLYDAHSKIVYAVALRVLRDPTSAEDVLHDVFLGIWRSPTYFVPAGSNLHGWLAIIARNLAVSVLRNRRSENSFYDLSLETLGCVCDKSTLSMERGKNLVEKIPKVEREALEMAFFGGLTHAEIAKYTYVPAETIKTRIRSALQSLGSARTMDYLPSGDHDSPSTGQSAECASCSIVLQIAG